MPLTDTYRVVVSYSEAEDPSEYGVLKVQPFKRRNSWSGSGDSTREEWQECWHHDDYWCRESIWAHAYLARQNMDQRCELGEETITDHAFVPHPDLLCWLSSNAYGGWYRNGDTFGDESDGALVLKQEDPWWHKLSSPEQQEAIDAFLEEYSAWASGETYYALLQQWQDGTPCATHWLVACAHEAQWADMDGIGGLIGDKGVIEQVKEWASEYKVDWKGIEIEYE